MPETTKKWIISVVAAFAVALAALIVASPRDHPIVVPYENGQDVIEIEIKPGMTVALIGDLLEQNEVIASAEFVKQAFSRDIATQLGAPRPSIEGYIFPGRYKFARRVNITAVLREFVSNQRMILATRFAKGGSLLMDIDTAIVLASLATTAGEKENYIGTDVLVSLLRDRHHFKPIQHAVLDEYMAKFGSRLDPVPNPLPSPLYLATPICVPNLNYIDLALRLGMAAEYAPPNALDR